MWTDLSGGGSGETTNSKQTIIPSFFMPTKPSKLGTKKVDDCKIKIVAFRGQEERSVLNVTRGRVCIV